MNGAVLVTGATGTVGRHLVAELLAAGQDVHAGVQDPAGADLPPDAVAVRSPLGPLVAAARERGLP